MTKGNSDAAILAALERVIARLDEHDRRLNEMQGVTASNEKYELEMKLQLLDKLTMKRLAVLTATLGGLSYQQIADLMQCEVTTVKLALRYALQILDIPSRPILLANHSRMLDDIPNKTHKTRYGIDKNWWLEQDSDVMNQLRAQKPARNQHTRSRGEKPD
jgi:DNA-binding CsgD family transcriptional regulator